MIQDLPIKPKEVLVGCSDTTAVNSGTGKVGGACFWYQELSEAVCFVSPSLLGMPCRHFGSTPFLDQRQV